MKTVKAETQNWVMTIKCNCGWVLAEACPWKGLDDRRTTFGQCSRCHSIPDKKEIDAALASFKEAVLCETWSQALAQELIDFMVNESPTEWRAHCVKCGFEIRDTMCGPSEIASIIINEQLRGGCSNGKFHELILHDCKREKDIKIRGAHVVP